MALKKVHNQTTTRSADFAVNASKGFTLIEMLVVVAIIAVVSGIILFNYSDFSTNVSVRNLTQEVALSIRKAQTYATSVRVIDGQGSTASSSYPGYGIVFSTVPGGSGSPATTPTAKRFVLFADRYTTTTDPTAGVYNQKAGDPCGVLNPGDECLETVAITTADTVSNICVNDSSTCSLKDVTISFRRPAPDALICYTASAGSTSCTASNATITLRSAKGLTRTVQVWNTGQISVQ